MPYFNKVRTLGSARFGFTHDLVHEGDEVYLERWIVWFGFTLRLHKFHKGDDDRAFHDHPWWFVTIPLSDYLESTPTQSSHVVKRWRPHFRSAKHRHIVQLIEGKPVFTLIITGPKTKEWGFWDNNQFVHHEHWLSDRQRPPAAEIIDT
ncbi:MAG: hypothetical protein AAF993_15920 [Pseudomonadota bacterium]